VGLWLTQVILIMWRTSSGVTGQISGGEVPIHKRDAAEIAETSPGFLPFKIPCGRRRVCGGWAAIVLGRYECEVIHTPGHGGAC